MDGNVFASGSSDLTFRVWDIRMKNPAFRVYEKNKCGVSSIRFMPENINTLAVGYEDASVRIWDLRAVWPIGKLNDKGYESVTSMAFSKSGRLLFSSHNANKIKVWDILTETKLWEFGGDPDHTDVIKAVNMSEDGSTLLSSGKDGFIHKWQVKAK
jgi:guanine nucleotide-binding protein G(I)/G(S)/G(T) subunit beta-1